MAARRTRITLSIPWDDEDHEHPAQWGYDVLLGIDSSREVIVVDWLDVPNEGCDKSHPVSS